MASIRLLFILSLLFTACTQKAEDDLSEIIEEVEDEIVVEDSIADNIEEDIVIHSNPNILLVLIDDIGKDALSTYSEGVTYANTPTLDSIANSGLLFNNMWVNPACSPTRASLITGKYPSNNGVLAVSEVLSSSETTLHKYIRDNTNDTYSTALIGKWHLSGLRNMDSPLNYGVDYYMGTMEGGTSSYYDWELSDGENTTAIEDTYITTKFTDLAIDWIDEQEQPWFLWLAYTAPHTPFHAPPSNLHYQGTLTDNQSTIDANPLPYYLASIEALDTELSRLLSTIPDLENTVIIILGDNGVDAQVAQTPYEQGQVKGSLHEGGINTPFFISGPSIRIGTDNGMHNVTDLFTTIGNIAGVSTTSIHDSQSFYQNLVDDTPSDRSFNYSETTNGYTVYNGTYKYMLTEQGNEKFFDLSEDPYESINYIRRTMTTEQTTAKDKLIVIGDSIRNANILF
ncbi:sulfatase [Flammeovirga pectinis]|uniref:Sulfatase n=1 Tax=Flammeovirga pectinis TaxID=2494373 RepID=A0A3S9NZB6_9BACT|nr:sulfatase-like hydrolase/transferase [Flammeovirga pectinis]AZQ61279.1 sulfatase [Flammeovirga pectinis]